MLGHLTRRTRSAAILATAALAVTACTSGGGGDAPRADGKVGLTVFAPQDPNQKLSANSLTKQLEKQLGVAITWQTTTYDGASASEKRQISLASGDLPDAYLLIPWVTQFSPAELQKYGKQGVFLPLNDLIDQYAPNIKKAFAETPQWKRIATAPDGKIYGLPQWNDCFHCSYGTKLWMNSAWLKKLGLKQPTTTEELRSVLRAFKTKDPNGNGKADEIPLTGLANNVEGGLIPYLMNAFIYDPGPSKADVTPLGLSGGKVQFQAAAPAFRAGLEYIASLYSERLIDPAAFSQNYDAMKAEGDNANGVLVGAAATLHPANLVTLGQKDGRDKQYDALPPLTGPSGARYATWGQPSAGGAFVLTAKTSTEQQIAAIKIVDYLVSTQGHLRAEFGEDGVNWVKPAAGEKALDPSLTPLFKTLPAKEGAPPANNAWGAMAQYYSSMAFRNAQVQPTDVYEPSGYERRLFNATKLYEGLQPRDQLFPSWSVWVDPADQADVAQLQTNLQNFAAQQQLQWVTGQKPLDDASWNAYLERLNALGLQRYLTLMQKAYDASK
ncbi:ABC transporter substrate-binding protein [Terrabacter sp. GCM10028922]